MRVDAVRQGDVNLGYGHVHLHGCVRSSIRNSTEEILSHTVHIYVVNEESSSRKRYFIRISCITSRIWTFWSAVHVDLVTSCVRSGPMK